VPPDPAAADLRRRYDCGRSASDAGPRRVLDRAPEHGIAIAFGPVADPAGGWGVGIIAAPSDEAIRELQRDDPAIRAGIGMRHETLPMPQIVVGRPGRAAA
jgi:hypothetical protein